MSDNNPGRLVLLSTTHRVAPGLLSWPAWRTLHEAAAVRVADEGHPLLPALREADVAVEVGPCAALALLEEARAADGDVVWVLGADGEPGLVTGLASAAVRGETLPEVEMLPASYDLPGARLLDLVAVMDRLRSPGGCPWDARQTHASLVTYLIEECYELVEAIEDGERADLREELGDVLLQVVFHARMAEEDEDEPFSIDDVAGGIVEKLMNRHPHVFGDVVADSADQVARNWEQLKAEEKGRASSMDGVPMAQPALSLAGKLMSRAEKAGVAVDVPRGGSAADGAALGDLLLGIVADARERGLDAEAALRGAARRYAERVRGAER
ncbi:nucleoside triphosphate pyrophosphohydrolase [Mangrovactinospora gilvigrisea]|uniref:Nucleoside triphosphate pyrophosphohydrolase n=1 Tax=Mangrovactinospora gilvigrisea TaxID=1428644 RepID=A0A1J7BJT5_9ACTN|nr:MazG family protein [Mangrovactinospora gilvigrisea]OIV38853.1 nucleoside triphosphate pyrophosphohydrolase [Mangrovactinospora gilvigrisea]